MHLIIFTLLLSWAFQVNAASISQERSLDFGTIAIIDNSAAYTMHMSFSGEVNADPAFLIISPGHPAEFFLSGFLPNSNLTIDILVPSETTESTAGSGSGTSQFTISNHHSFYSTVTTDSLGEATINVGATLTSSGSGNYQNATFFAPMTIVVSY